MVRVVPRVRFEEMPRYLRIADAGIFFINPYKKFGSSPIKLGEFLACGVPVVINPGVGDTEEIVRENRVGVVVRDFDEARYERGANELLALRGEGDGLKARCRDTARRYLSLEDGANKYYEIYKKILQN
jgi:glycosyltransferase involved in cell wall biosynthesis